MNVSTAIADPLLLRVKRERDKQDVRDRRDSKFRVRSSENFGLQPSNPRVCSSRLSRQSRSATGSSSRRILQKIHRRQLSACHNGNIPFNRVFHFVPNLPGGLQTIDHSRREPQRRLKKCQATSRERQTAESLARSTGRTDQASGQRRELRFSHQPALATGCTVIGLRAKPDKAQQPNLKQQRRQRRVLARD